MFVNLIFNEEKYYTITRTKNSKKNKWAPNISCGLLIIIIL